MEQGRAVLGIFMERLHASFIMADRFIFLPKGDTNRLKGSEWK
jgi:hypothetical protein